MEQSLVNKTLKEFVTNVASKSAAPGGGSIAAAAGALAAGLTAMVCRFTIGNEKYKDHWDEFQQVLDSVEALKQELIELVDRDSEAYNNIVKIFKTKKDINDEQSQLEFAGKLEKAYQNAAEVPLTTARKSYEILRFAKIAAENGNVNTITDAGVGAQMAYAAVSSAALNVEINLKSIEDEEYVTELHNDIVELENKSKNLIEDVMETINRKL